MRKGCISRMFVKNNQWALFTLKLSEVVITIVPIAANKRLAKNLKRKS